MSAPPTAERPAAPLVERHLRFGWWSLFVYLALGLVLEGMHGLKVGWYLDVTNSTRRLMWTLAHAHGTLLGLVHLGFALTVSLRPGWTSRSRDQASLWLVGAGVALPLGFLLGGFLTYGGDPGLGIALAAVGGLMLLIAVFLTCTARASAGGPAAAGSAGPTPRRGRSRR